MEIADADAMSGLLSEDGDIAVAQLLGIGATRYAGATITATVGEPPPGSSVLEALALSRQMIAAADHLPTSVAEALRSLQVVAVLFTMQLAISEDHGALEVLRRIEDELIAKLEQGTAGLHGHDCASAARVLGDRALDYAHQIVFAEDNSVSIGSDAVERSIMKLQVAATMFTARLAIAEGRDPAPPHPCGESKPNSSERLRVTQARDGALYNIETL